MVLASASPSSRPWCEKPACEPSGPCAPEPPPAVWTLMSEIPKKRCRGALPDSYILDILEGDCDFIDDPDTAPDLVALS
ncbi:MAG: hypothetical protein PVG39_27455 [Desulfobacteraceae bacterium]